MKLKRFFAFALLLTALPAWGQKAYQLPNLATPNSNSLFITTVDAAGGGSRHTSYGQISNSIKGAILSSTLTNATSGRAYGSENEVNVVDYGATAHVPVNIVAGSYITNALADSSSAIQSAFNAAYNSNGRSNTVFFPKGIYQINTNIYVPPGINVRGVGLLHAGDFATSVDRLDTNAFSVLWQTNLLRAGLVFSNLNLKGSWMSGMEIIGHTNPLAYGLTGTGNMADSASSTLANGPGLFLGANTVTDWATNANAGTGYSGDVQIYNSAVVGFKLGIRSTVNSANFRRMHMVACDVGYETSDLCCGGDQTIFDNCSAALRPNGVGYLLHNNGASRGVTFLSPSDYQVGTWMRATDCVVSVSGGNLELDHPSTTASHVLELYGSAPVVNFTGTRILGTTSHTNLIYYGETAYAGPYGGLRGVRIQGLPLYTNTAWNGTMTNYNGGGMLLVNANGYYGGGFKVDGGTGGWGLSRSNNATGVAFYTFPLSDGAQFAPATMQPIVWGSQAWANPGFPGPTFTQYGRPSVIRGDSTPDYMVVRLLSTRQGPMVSRQVMLGDASESTNAAPPNTLTLAGLKADTITNTSTTTKIIGTDANGKQVGAVLSGATWDGANFTVGGSGSASNAVSRIFTNGVLVAADITNLNIIAGSGVTLGQTNGNQTVGLTITASGTGFSETATNGWLSTTNVTDRYGTNTLTIGQGPQNNLNSAIHFVGGATPHIELYGPSSWFDVNMPLTNSADVIHAGGLLVVGDGANFILQTGTIADSYVAATLTRDTEVDTIAEVETIWGRKVTTNNATLPATSLMIGDGARGVAPTTTGSGVLTALGNTANAASGFLLYDAELAAIGGLTSAADKIPYFTGSGTAGLVTIGTGLSFSSGTLSATSATQYFYTNSAAAGSISNAFDVKIDGDFEVTGTLVLADLTVSNANFFNVGGSGLYLTLSNNVLALTNTPAGGAGDAVLASAQTWTGVNTLSNDWKMDAASALYLSNLTTARVLVYNTANGVTNTGATGPLLGTGSAAAASDINGLFPSNLLTNGAYQAGLVFSNTMVFATSGVPSVTISNGQVTATTFSGALSSTSTATTASAGDNDTSPATTAFVTTAVLNGTNNAAQTWDTEWNTIAKIVTATGADILTNNRAPQTYFAGGVTFYGTTEVDAATFWATNRVGIGPIDANGIISTNQLQVATPGVTSGALNVGTNGTTYGTFSGSGAALTSVPGTVGVVRDWEVPMGSWFTNGTTTPATLTSWTNTGDSAVFSDAVTNDLRVRFALPAAWDAGAIQWQFTMGSTTTNTATTLVGTNVVFGISAATVAHNASETALTFGTEILFTNRLSKTNYWTTQCTTPAVTVGATAGGRKDIVWALRRVTGNTGDATTNAVSVIHSRIVFQETTTEPSMPAATN